MLPKWLVNIVMVHKGDEGWRMCVDFTNLKKAYLKDNYLMPKVDALVDKSSGCELLNFMVTRFDYNQVTMSKEDEEKTSFITEEGTFCFRVMLIGLCKVGVTFQRLMD